MARASKTPQARRDLVEIATYIAIDDPAATERFLSAAEDAFTLLAAMPGLGAPRSTDSRRLRGLRSWPIAGFRKYLIFYTQARGGIRIIRVLHGARDLNSALEEE